jgi:glutathione S-transferase
LNYKGIPYRTEWIEYPDIAEKFKELGIPPSDGAQYYSCPAIIDPSTGAKVSESFKIAEYLEKTYPDTPKLFPPGTWALQAAFYKAFEEKMFPMLPMGISKCFSLLNEASKPYIRLTREKFFGKKMEELVPDDKAERDAMWQKVEDNFGAIDAWYEKGKGDGPHLLGEELGFADITVAAWLIFIKCTFREESEEWKNTLSWHEGRWAAAVATFDKFQTVH